MTLQDTSPLLSMLAKVPMGHLTFGVLLFLNHIMVLDSQSGVHAKAEGGGWIKEKKTNLKKL